jgi:MarR family transcriptional regulator, 2-MHQ and catechol-resistance regulon repressor
MPPLEVGDPLAHRALDALVKAEASVRRALAAELEREGVSAAGFSALVTLMVAAGELELKVLRRRLGWSKPNATEVVTTLELRGLVTRRRSQADRRNALVRLTAPGVELVDRLFPEHTRRVSGVFAGLGDEEKRHLTEICRKLAA